MKFVGARPSNQPTWLGRLSEDTSSVTLLTDLESFWQDPSTYLRDSADGLTVPVNDVEIVPPILPDARILCIGLNYLKHVAEGSYADDEIPPYPTLFARWPRSLTIDGAQIPVPANEAGLDWEGEVVAYVGSTLVDATPEEAHRSVVAYSVFNDLTARAAQKLTSQWILGKNADRSGPLGPIVPAAEVGDLRNGLRLRTRVNGTVVQDATTDQMVYTIDETLSMISRTMTLNPGDLLATGTPAGVGYARTPPWLLIPGDVVEVEVDRIGSISNSIVDNSLRHVWATQGEVE